MSKATTKIEDHEPIDDSDDEQDEVDNTQSNKMSNIWWEISKRLCEVDTTLRILNDIHAGLSQDTTAAAAASAAVAAAVDAANIDRVFSEVVELTRLFAEFHAEVGPAVQREHIAEFCRAFTDERHTKLLDLFQQFFIQFSHNNKWLADVKPDSALGQCIAARVHAACQRHDEPAHHHTHAAQAGGGGGTAPLLPPASPANSLAKVGSLYYTVFGWPMHMKLFLERLIKALPNSTTTIVDRGNLNEICAILSKILRASDLSILEVNEQRTKYELGLLEKRKTPRTIATKFIHKGSAIKVCKRDNKHLRRDLVLFSDCLCMTTQPKMNGRSEVRCEFSIRTIRLTLLDLTSGHGGAAAAAPPTKRLSVFEAPTHNRHSNSSSNSNSNSAAAAVAAANKTNTLAPPQSPPHSPPASSAAAPFQFGLRIKSREATIDFYFETYEETMEWQRSIQRQVLLEQERMSVFRSSSSGGGGSGGGGRGAGKGGGGAADTDDDNAANVDDGDDDDLSRWTPGNSARSWQKDEDCSMCNAPACTNKFSATLRRHHCRCCGLIFCDACCWQKLELAFQMSAEPQLVCQLCCAYLNCVNGADELAGNSLTQFRGGERGGERKAELLQQIREMCAAKLKTGRKMGWIHLKQVLTVRSNYGRKELVFCVLSMNEPVICIYKSREDKRCQQKIVMLNCEIHLKNSNFSPKMKPTDIEILTNGIHPFALRMRFDKYTDKNEWIEAFRSSINEFSKNSADIMD